MIPRRGTILRAQAELAVRWRQLGRTIRREIAGGLRLVADALDPRRRP